MAPGITMPVLPADGQGGIQGGDSPFGRDWQAGPDGWLTGSGTNYRRAWRTDGQGGYDEVGNNFGSAWQRP